MIVLQEVTEPADEESTWDLQPDAVHDLHEVSQLDESRAHETDRPDCTVRAGPIPIAMPA